MGQTALGTSRDKSRHGVGLNIFSATRIQGCSRKYLCENTNKNEPFEARRQCICMFF